MFMYCTRTNSINFIVFLVCIYTYGLYLVKKSKEYELLIKSFHLPFVNLFIHSPLENKVT